jgi:hypothetical protein
MGPFFDSSDLLNNVQFWYLFFEDVSGFEENETPPPTDS